MSLFPQYLCRMIHVCVFFIFVCVFVFVFSSVRKSMEQCRRAAGRLIMVLQRVKRPKLNSFVFPYLSDTNPPTSICQHFVFTIHLKQNFNLSPIFVFPYSSETYPPTSICQQFGSIVIFHDKLWRSFTEVLRFNPALLYVPWPK